LAIIGASAVAQTIHGREGITLPVPPAVETVPVSDDYFGTKISDSYRWLEDARSPETRAFIDAQNAYTARYLKQARIRAQAVDDLDALESVSQTHTPWERAGSYFFRKRLAGEQQFSIYVRPGWTGKDERLIDPAKLSRDPNTSVGLEDVSRDGALVAYSVQQGGADETSVQVFNVKTGKTLEDELPTARYLGVSFAPAGDAQLPGHAGVWAGVSRRAAYRQRPFLGGGDRRWPLPGHSDRSWRAGQARGHRLPRSDQAGLAL
jgi:prolyl oligopeptidase